MFSADELGLLAYLNDNALISTNRNLQMHSPDTVASAIDRYLRGGGAGDRLEEDRLLARLGDMHIGKDILARTTKRVREHLERGSRIVTYWDTSYPRNLRFFPDPPLMMFVEGGSFPGRDHTAVVGTVHPSRAGSDLAYEYGARRARKGRTVVSGLARGIDAQVLEGSLGSNGAPIAVLGAPLTDDLSEELKGLRSEIARNGALVSEVTEEACLHPGRLMQRNRPSWEWPGAWWSSSRRPSVRSPGWSISCSGKAAEHTSFISRSSKILTMMRGSEG